MSQYSKFLEIISGSARTVDLSSSSNSLGLANLTMLGSTSGTLSIAASATTTSYSLILPAAQGASGSYLKNDGSGNLSWSAAGIGSVTSVAFADDSSTPIYTVSGSPVTSSGTLAITLATQSANTIFAGPSSGSAAQPTFRSLVSADIPNNAANTTGTASNITATSNATLTTLSALTSASSLSSVGTITSGTWNGTAIAIANGGTGQTTAAAAFAALSPMTTAGDLIYENSTPAPARLPIGSSGQVLTVSGGLPVWASPATSGTVTSVAFADDSSTPIYTVSGSPVTSSGTLAITLATQSANTIFAGPSSGSAAQPTFRSLVSADIPNNAANTTGTASNVTATSNSTLTTLSALTTASSLSSVGTITSGTWNGTAIGAQYGGTGINTSSSTGVPTISSGTWSVQSQLPISLGGTGTASTSQNYVFAGPTSGSGTPSFRALVAGDIPSLSATYVTQSEVGAANGVASLDGTGKVPVAQLPSTVMQYLGTWYPAGVVATFYGTVILNGAIPVTLGLAAVTPGTAGNSISITGTGAASVATLIANWNAANPSNQVVLTSGSNSWVIEPSDTATLSGGQAPNYPVLADGTGTNGDVYYVGNNYSGTLSGLTDPSMYNFLTSDLIIYNGSKWQLVSPNMGVQSVNAAMGAVTLTMATANGFAGTYSGTALTVSTTITGILKGNGTSISAATAGTDYVIPSGSITGTASNITATSNSTLTTLSALTTASSLSSVGTITSGTWNGTAIGATYGGTGVNSSSSTGIAHVSSGTWTFSSIVPADLGTITDGVTLDQSGSGSTLEVKAGGISATQLATGAFDQATITGGAGTHASVAYAPANKRVLTAGQSFSANTSYAVRWGNTAQGETANRVYAADIATSSWDKFYVIGMASSSSAVSAGQTITVTSFGSFTLSSSDTAFGTSTAGQPVFLNSNGGFTLTAPSTATQAIVRIGMVQADSATNTSCIIDVSAAQVVGVN